MEVQWQQKFCQPSYQPWALSDAHTASPVPPMQHPTTTRGRPRSSPALIPSSGNNPSEQRGPPLVPPDPGGIPGLSRGRSAPGEPLELARGGPSALPRCRRLWCPRKAAVAMDTKAGSIHQETGQDKMSATEGECGATLRREGTLP